MKATSSIEIKASKEKVWQMVTDYLHWSEFISAILKVEVLEEPSSNFMGFKWKETRMMFGKEATEIMWVTDVKVNSYYKTRAESHGAVYLTNVSIEEKGDVSILTQEFEGLPQKLLGKIMMGLMGGMMKKATEKGFYVDLVNMKQYVENQMD